MAATTPAQLAESMPINFWLTAFDPMWLYWTFHPTLSFWPMSWFSASLASLKAARWIFVLHQLRTQLRRAGLLHAGELYAYCSRVGGDSFTFKVSDGFGDSNLATVNLILRYGALELTVNSTEDSVDGACDSHCSLREAVESSIAGDSITFDPAVSGTIALQMGRLHVNHDLTISGPGAGLLTISGSVRSGISKSFGFNEAPISSTISGLTLKNGRGEFGGAIINLPNSTLKLEDCVIGRTIS